MKTLLDKEIEKVEKALYQQTKTSWYDSGVRNVCAEGYYEGLKKAKRLVNKQNKLDAITKLKGE
jgi:hypothetical protein